jgi:hypothetical protein
VARIVQRGKVITPPGRPGHPGDDPAAWPEHLQSLVRQFGGERVHRGGLAALHYPPAWTAAVSECRGLLPEIERVS